MKTANNKFLGGTAKASLELFSDYAKQQEIGKPLTAVSKTLREQNKKLPMVN